MSTIANAKVAHNYNCYNGYFFGCLPIMKNYQTKEQLAILRYNQLKTKRERNGMNTASLNEGGKESCRTMNVF